MWTRKYAISLGLITIALLAIATVLWSKGAAPLTPDIHSEGERWRGAQNALITIDVYPDFDCSICVEKERLVLQALDLYLGKLKMVYHPYPSSEFGWKLAEALEAAGEQGKFWELHDRFLKSTPHSISELNDYARSLGLDFDTFEKALNTGVFKESIELAKEKAVSQGVTRVAIFINGSEYQPSPGTITDLRSAIDRELERLGNR
jgi:protein-disulfide isomerase